MKKHYEAIIIGSGIAGMTTAIYLKRGGINPLIIEESAPGGQLNRITTIENYPGYLKINGPELTEEIYKQVSALDIEYLFDKVIKVDLNKEEKEITTINNKLTCKYLVIATGRLSKKLFKNDDDYAGKGISYCALCDGPLYKKKNVAVVGGGNSALEESLYLSEICNKVTLIHRNDSFRGDKTLVDQVLSKKNIDCVYNSNITEYNIENGKLTSVLLDNGNKIEVSGLFISIGSVPSTDIFDVTKEKGFIIVDDECMTNINNVYACGDVIKKNVYQLTTAASEGTIVAYSIIKKNKK
ncbi:MAG: FAD-dependent oxidoreductase [Mycoplasmatota bacterium]|nr:FAD-dependent oxidoreductase [Mycoplasmatota bacterium]